MRLLCQGLPTKLISDLRLEGDEHGAALACRLQERYGAFPVLIMTGDISSSALQVAHEAGFVVLQKPVSADSLRAVLCEMLG
jgi:DNA-binding NtrC family response regulator